MVVGLLQHTLCRLCEISAYKRSSVTQLILGVRVRSSEPTTKSCPPSDVEGVKKNAQAAGSK